MNALAGLMNPMAVGQSFQMGMEQGRARRGEMETQNALSMLARDPNSAEGFEKLVQYNPQAAMQIGQQRQAAQAKEQAAAMDADLTARALQGDDTALTQLATTNFEKWAKIDTRMKAQAVEESALLGEAALDILQVPPGEQRRARLITYAQQFPQFAEKINEVAFLPPAEQETQLRAVIANAKMVGKLHEMERPSYQAIPEGGTLVNTRDPGAVAQFQQGAGAPMAIPPISDIDAELRRRGVIR